MILNNYNIKEELMVPLEQYERDNNISPIILVENLLEEFLYKKGYIKVEEEVYKTPEDIKNERKNKFKIKKWRKGYCKLFFEDTYFGRFNDDKVEDIIKNLLDFSDDELKELDYNRWVNKYPKEKYKKFIYEKIKNPELTPETFYNKNKISVWKRRNCLEFRFKKELIGNFNKDKWSEEQINKVQCFLNELSAEELLFLINKRKNSKEISSKVVFDYMEESFKNNLPKKKYTTIQHGKYLIQKGINGHYYAFGTHSKEKIDNVLEFLDNKNWDIHYSTKQVGLGGCKYIDWLYSEIEKENNMKS